MKKGISWVKRPSWRLRGWVTHWVSQRSDTKKMSILSESENQWDLPKGCKKPRLFVKRHTHTYFLPVVAWRKHIENCRGSWPFSHDSLSKHPACIGWLGPFTLALPSTREEVLYSRRVCILKGNRVGLNPILPLNKVKEKQHQCGQKQQFENCLWLWMAWWTIPEHTPACRGSCSSTSWYSSAFY